MPNLSWESVINAPVPGSGTAYNTSTTLTDVTPAPQLTIPANFLQVGSVVKVTAWGTFANASTTPTLLLGVYYGGVAGTSLGNTGAVTTTSSASTLPWRLEFTFRVASVGSSGTIFGQGFVDLGTSLTAVTRIPIPNVALAAVTIDTTTAKALTIGAQWGTSAAGNTLQVLGVIIESMA